MEFYDTGECPLCGEHTFEMYIGEDDLHRVVGIEFRCVYSECQHEVALNEAAILHAVFQAECG